jgi:teichuronic acid biosynthesis glycosyltransferase TuaG
MNASVSVIIPTYNRAHLLRRAVESALNQRPCPREIIVADDGSDDDTERVVKQLSLQVRYVRIAHSGLPAVARNAGLAIAKERFVAFLDSDDLWLPGKLAGQLDVLDRSPGVVLVASNARVTVDDNGTEGNLLQADLASGPVSFEKLLSGNIIVASSVLARRDAVVGAGGFRSDRFLRAVEDYDLWLRLALVGDLHFLAEPFVAYREHQGSIRREQSRQAYYDALARVFARLHGFPQGRQLTKSERMALQNAERAAHFAHMDIAWQNRDLRSLLWHPRRAIPWLAKKVNHRVAATRNLATEHQ